ncbi:hypothetical protein [Maritalea sp.]|uniref:hypothetical protein n=1 Tax=Maritalea sp. TaxID=2003361 RepID=UPI003EF9D7ED
MSTRPPITYADTVPTLPSSDFATRLKEVRIARIFAQRSAANQNATDRTQEAAPSHLTQKTMVEKERPHPAPRPSPDFAADVDAAAFNARWEAERQRIQSQSPKPHTGAQDMSDKTNEPRRPEDTLREGPLKAAIWRNDGENGAYHSVTVARTYKDQDGKLQDTQSFRPKDMLGLSELARQAHHKAHDLDRAQFKERRQTAQDQAQKQTKGRSR